MTGVVIGDVDHGRLCLECFEVVMMKVGDEIRSTLRRLAKKERWANEDIQGW